MESESAAMHRKMRQQARQLPITGSAHKAGVVGNDGVAAIVAALNMTAERRRTARLDRSHHAKCGSVEVARIAG